MSLDEFPNTNSWLNSNNTKGLSEMLYYVKSQKRIYPLKPKHVLPAIQKQAFIL